MVSSLGFSVSPRLHCDWKFIGLRHLHIASGFIGAGGSRRAVFTWAFHGFAIGNMLFGGIALVADALLLDRWKALWAFVAIYIVSLASDLLGTAYGIPFGAYSYTELLGAKWFDRVPLLSIELVYDELGVLGNCASA